MHLRSLIILSFLFILQNPLVAQYVNYGQEPTRTKWQIIKTEHYNIIFPKGAEYQGQRVAGMLNNVYSVTGKTLNHEHKKWDVVLHPNSITGLAYVFPAPRRSEWKTMQHQSTECLEWINNLTVHETRHMVQQSLIEEEMPKVFKYLLGQHAAPIIIGAYLPFWYMEGDATCNEAGLTPTGSGRSPDFLMANRAILVDGEPYSMEKAYLGSYKNHVPNWYETGYLMTGGARYLYKKTIWDEVLHNVAKKPLLLTSFNNGLKRSIGLSKYQLYDSTFNYFKDYYKKQNQELEPTFYNVISKKNKYFSNYVNGAQLSNGLYFARKSSLNERSKFVVINKYGMEKNLTRLGYGFSESVNANNSMVVWVENRPHVRWEQKNWSVIRIMDLNTNKKSIINHKKRYVAPVLSTDNKTIAVVEVSPAYKFYLKTIDAKSEKVTWTFSTPDNAYFINPTWSADGESLYCILLKNDKQALVQIELKNNSIDTLIPFCHQHLKNPVEWGTSVYFVGGFTGINNLYSIDKESKQIYKETEARFGIVNPSINERELTYSDYTIDGYELVSTKHNRLLHEPVDIDEIQISYPVANAIAKQEKQLVDFKNIKTDYPIEKYSKAKNILNIHSWGPFALDISEQMVYPGFSVSSQNLLSTTELVAGYKYYTQDKLGAAYANLKYMGLFPVFEADVEYGKQKADYIEINRGDTALRQFTWQQTDFDLRMYVPFNLNRGCFFNRIMPKLGYALVNKSDVSVSNLNFDTGISHRGQAGLYMYSILRKSPMDVLADFGMIFNFNYSTVISETFNEEYINSAENWFYLPGFAKTHGLKLYNGYQYKKQDEYSFGNYIRMARGYTSLFNTELHTLGADYIFPIAHPDWAMLKIMYINRIKGSVYYDRTWYKSYYFDNDNKVYYSDIKQSSGFELSAQIYFFQLPAPLNLGVRTNYLFNKEVNYDFLFGVNLEF